MKIGIGLPNPVPGTPGPLLLEWAQLAEERGFSGLATIDRVIYPSHDSLATLAAAAAVTSRIELMSNILVAPAYQPVMLAKATATVHALSQGRFTLGAGVGGRPDDFAGAERDFHTRGRDFDAGLELMHAAWRGEVLEGFEKPVCNPVADGGVPVMIGGHSDQAVSRTARWGVGWTSGGAPPEAAAQMVERVMAGWRDSGREGTPRLAVLAYYSLGDDATAGSRRYLNDYYGFLGDYAAMIADGALRSEEAIAGAIEAFGEAGITEIYFDPTVADLSQVERLAEVALT